jgi:hypothetical protein
MFSMRNIMHKMNDVRMLAVLVCAALLSGCAGQPAIPNSGYLGGADAYSELKEAKDPRGAPILSYVSPKLTPANYSAVIIDPLVYYPTPKPTKEVSEQTLREIGQYINQALRQAVGQKVQVVDKPGPGVARISIAITAVREQEVALEAYQYVPFAFIATTASRAATGTPQQARLLNELKIVDSVSNERLGMQVRSGTGEELKRVAGGGSQVTLASVKPLIDKWIEAGAEGVTRYIRAK